MSNNWIFLRGLTRGNIHWGSFPDLFLAANPAAQVEYLEIPGNGMLSNEATPTDPEVVVEYLKRNSQLAQSNVTYNLCGISLGGMIALKWAQMYPEAIESVTVINSSLSQYSSFYQRLRPANYLKLFEAIFANDVVKQEEIILRITSNKFEQNKKYLNSFAQFAAVYQVTRANFVRQLILAKNIKINKLSNKNLHVLSSAQDRLVHSSCSGQIAKGLKGNLVIHPTSGHDLALDEPEWLIEQLLTRPCSDIKII